MKRDRIGGEQRRNELFVLRLVECAIDVIGTIAFVVARLPPGLGRIDALGIDDGRDRVEESEGLLAGLGGNGPLTAPALAEAIAAETGEQSLAFIDDGRG